VYRYDRYLLQELNSSYNHNVVRYKFFNVPADSVYNNEWNLKQRTKLFKSGGECLQLQLLMPNDIRTNRIQLLGAATDGRLSGIPCFRLRRVMGYMSNIII
jgi:hypothetical protein